MDKLNVEDLSISEKIELLNLLRAEPTMGVKGTSDVTISFDLRGDQKHKISVEPNTPEARAWAVSGSRIDISEIVIRELVEKLDQAEGKTQTILRQWKSEQDKYQPLKMRLR